MEVAWLLGVSLVAQNLLGRLAGRQRQETKIVGWGTLHVIGPRPVLLSCDLPTRNLHNCPPWLSLCPLAAMPDHGSTGPPRCHIAFAPSDPALLTATSPLQRQLLPACRLSPLSTMADSIRGDGVLRAHCALDALLDDPERLQRDRERFSWSPPAYRSQLPAPRRDPRAPTASAMIKSGETR